VNVRGRIEKAWVDEYYGQEVAARQDDRETSRVRGCINEKEGQP
jgi:hypothetical protein